MIPYPVRFSQRARRVAIVVTLEGIEIVAPEGAGEERIAAFLAARKRFIHNRTVELRERSREAEIARLRLTGPERWVSGAKVPFRGRRLLLRVEPAAVAAAELRYATAFHVRVPEAAEPTERETLVEACVTAWLKEKAGQDAADLAASYSRQLGVTPPPIRIKSLKTLWGSCSKEGAVTLNWRLIAAPRPIFEYVIVHELCHLLERHHGPAFWRRVAGLLPDFESRKNWLDRRGIGLD